MDNPPRDGQPLNYDRAKLERLKAEIGKTTDEFFSFEGDELYKPHALFLIGYLEKLIPKD